MLNEVELWPAFHSYNYESHRQLLNYLLSIPDGSVVIMEMSPQLAFFLKQSSALYLGAKDLEKSLSGRYSNPEQFIDSLLELNTYGDIFDSVKISSELKEFIPGILAVMEILTLCKRKKILVFPVDINMGNNRMISGFNLEESELREKLFSEKIKRLLRVLGRRRVIFFSGLAHTESVLANLKNSGVNARINLDMYDDNQKNIIKRGLLKEKLVRAAKKEGKRFDLTKFNLEYPDNTIGVGVDGKRISYVTRKAMPKIGNIAKEFIEVSGRNISNSRRIKLRPNLKPAKNRIRPLLKFRL